MKLPFLNIKKKNGFFLVLDIGTEAIKALIVSRSFSQDRGQNKKVSVLGVGLAYFNGYDFFNKKEIKEELMRETISKAIESARENLSFSSVKKEVKKRVLKKKDWQILLTLPSNILKARVVRQSFSREASKKKISKKEEKEIKNCIFEASKKEISRKYAQEFGIMEGDIKWISLKITEIKIDGYRVPSFSGCQGKRLDFKIFVSFLPSHYFNNMERLIVPLNLKILKTVHIAESLPFLSKMRRMDGLFLDIGGEMTQIFEFKNGQVQWVDEFKKGGNDFIENLSQRLGVDEDTARSLERQYSEGSLSPEVSERIKEIFFSDKKIWYDDLKKRLDKVNLKPFVIFIFGGGSFISDFQNVLKENPFLPSPPKIDFIYLEDLEDVIDTTRGLDSPQYIPSLLTCYHI